MSNVASLISPNGDVLVTIGAIMDSGEECIFSNREFSEYKELIFRSEGGFRYQIENKTRSEIEIQLKDNNGKTNTRCLSPNYKLSLHTIEDELLFFDGSYTGPFEFVVNLNGIWKVSTDESDDSTTYSDRGSSAFSFYYILYNNIIFLSHEPVSDNKKEYVENTCCICLKENDLCTLIKCGHKCIHSDCMFKDNGLPNFTRCPLCRSNIIAVSVC